MIISMIAAHDPNLVIGKDGTLPWSVPEDMEHFRSRTKGHVIVMGRGVFEEIGEKPLPKRRNIVMTRSRSYPMVETCGTREEVFEISAGERKIYIIGGAEIYHLFYADCTRLEITILHKTYDGDTFFPEYRNELGIRWKEVYREEKEHLTFVDYDRIFR